LSELEHNTAVLNQTLFNLVSEKLKLKDQLHRFVELFTKLEHTHKLECGNAIDRARVHPVLSSDDINNDWRRCWKRPFIELVKSYHCDQTWRQVLNTIAPHTLITSDQPTSHNGAVTVTLDTGEVGIFKACGVGALSEVAAYHIDRLVGVFSRACGGVARPAAAGAARAGERQDVARGQGEPRAGGEGVRVRERLRGRRNDWLVGRVARAARHASVRRGATLVLGQRLVAGRRRRHAAAAARADALRDVVLPAQRLLAATTQRRHVCIQKAQAVPHRGRAVCVFEQRRRAVARAAVAAQPAARQLQLDVLQAHRQRGHCDEFASLADRTDAYNGTALDPLTLAEHFSEFLATVCMFERSHVAQIRTFVTTPNHLSPSYLLGRALTERELLDVTPLLTTDDWRRVEARIFWLRVRIDDCILKYGESNVIFAQDVTGKKFASGTRA
jgi:hypothetical protein